MTDETEAIRAQLSRALRDDPPIVPWKVDVARLIAANVATCLIVVAAVSPWQPAHSGDGLWWLTAGALVAMMFVGSALAIAPARKNAAWIAVGLAAVCVFLLVRGADPLRHASVWADAECALAEIAVSLVPAVLTALALARFAFQWIRAWVGGIAAAATGALGLHCTCVNESVVHVIIFHLAPSLLVALVLVAVRSRMTSRSFAP